MSPSNVYPFTRRPKRHPSHDVPFSGTLAQISYCRTCGAAFDDAEPCRMTRDWSAPIPQIGRAVAP